MKFDRIEQAVKKLTHYRIVSHSSFAKLDELHTGNAIGIEGDRCGIRTGTLVAA